MEKKLDKDINVRSKLTDEEIVKALAYCNNPDKEKGCVPCPYSRKTKGDIRCYMRSMHNDILDLIHRLQDEYNRLLESQKQVDELKERYLEESKERCEFEQKYKKIQHAHNIGLGAQRSHWEKKVEQSVKDTAKEILDELDLFFKGTTFRKGYEFKKIDQKLKEIAKQKGVEVE